MVAMQRVPKLAELRNFPATTPEEKVAGMVLAQLADAFESWGITDDDFPDEMPEGTDLADPVALQQYMPKAFEKMRQALGPEVIDEAMRRRRRELRAADEHRHRLRGTGIPAVGVSGGDAIPLPRINIQGAPGDGAARHRGRAESAVVEPWHRLGRRCEPRRSAHVGAVAVRETGRRNGDIPAPE